METTTITTSPTTDPVEAEQPTDEELGVWEKIELTADQLEDSLENLIHEGTARRITVKKDGEVIADFPLAVGVVGTLVAAPLAAVAAIVALIADCTIEVERERPADDAVEMPEPAADAVAVEMPEPAADAVADAVEMPAATAALTA
jgi:Domain of unknown function (DUF4342)